MAIRYGKEMNYIGHAVVSGSFDLFLLGQVLGDEAIRSELVGKEPELIRGVKAHRAVDEFTDSHPAVTRCCDILKPYCGRYSPVIMDVVIDFVLIKNWTDFSEVPYPDFVKSLYEVLELHESDLSPRMAATSRRMREMDWFLPFQDHDELYRVIERLALRSSRTVQMLAGREGVRVHWEELERLCAVFLKDLFREKNFQ